MKVREAPFALRVVDRQAGRSGVVYRRRPDIRGRDRLQKVGALSPLAFSAAVPLLREGAREAGASRDALKLQPGPFLPLDADWGARAACFAIVSSGLRDGERLLNAARHLREADGNEAAWWLGQLTGTRAARAARALRILLEAAG